MDERLILIIFWVVVIAISAVYLRYQYDKTKKKYDDLKDKYEHLKNDVKLLQQENFYLKKLLDQNADSVN